MIFNSVNRPVNNTYKPNVFNRFLIFLTNFFVNVYVSTDSSMNSNTIVCGKLDQPGGLYMVRVFEKSDFQTIYHVPDFCNILRHIVKTKVIQIFKNLLKSESVNGSDLIRSVYM